MLDLDADEDATLGVLGGSAATLGGTSGNLGIAAGNLNLGVLEGSAGNLGGSAGNLNLGGTSGILADTAGNLGGASGDLNLGGTSGTVGGPAEKLGVEGGIFHERGVLPLASRTPHPAVDAGTLNLGGASETLGELEGSAGTLNHRVLEGSSGTLGGSAGNLNLGEAGVVGAAGGIVDERANRGSLDGDVSGGNFYAEDAEAHNVSEARNLSLQAQEANHLGEETGLRTKGGVGGARTPRGPDAQPPNELSSTEVWARLSSFSDSNLLQATQRASKGV
ncbi:hypothetical protein T484DRAFT_1929737 [Baffinella frigidus]|nr:hypothetical protein T484DRAFT_1929737 [Cryptophyta sp. CCMP2293]